MHAYVLLLLACMQQARISEYVKPKNPKLNPNEMEEEEEEEEEGRRGSSVGAEAALL